MSCCANPSKCGGSGGCHGGTAELAMEYIKHNGLTADEQYPYVSGIDGVDQDCYFDQEVTKPVVKIDDWVMLERNDQYAVMEALVNKGPLIISAYASLWK